jgi:hypothetical protein
MAKSKLQRRPPKQYKDAAPEQIEVQPNSVLYRSMLESQTHIFRAQLLVLLNNIQAIDPIDTKTWEYDVAKLQESIVAASDMLVEMGKNLITVVQEMKYAADNENDENYEHE